MEIGMRTRTFERESDSIEKELTPEGQARVLSLVFRG
jgi:hypothetical protein